MKEPLVSILIPCFNAEDHLSETIQSALNQTWQKKEIIIVDDGSTDNSLSIAKSFEGPLVRVLAMQKNKGASAARNLALTIAKGEFIQFLDAGDLLSVNKIKDQVLSLDGENDILLYCPTIYFDHSEKLNQKLVDNQWFNEDVGEPVEFLIKLFGGYENLQASMIQPNAWLTSRQIIKKAGIWNENLSLDDDGDFFCRVILSSRKIKFVPSAINYYRISTNNQNLSSRKTEKAFLSALESIKQKSKYLLAENSGLNAKKAISRQYWELAIATYPSFKKISNMAISEALKLNEIPPANIYTHTKMYKLVTGIFGWKVSAWISYLKNYY